jgi:hypothetical protein
VLKELSSGIVCVCMSSRKSPVGFHSVGISQRENGKFVSTVKRCLATNDLEYSEILSLCKDKQGQHQWSQDSRLI